jgi:hypothetical protein
MERTTPLQKGLSQSHQGRKEDIYMKKPFADFAPLRDILAFFSVLIRQIRLIRDLQIRIIKEDIS